MPKKSKTSVRKFSPQGETESPNQEPTSGVRVEDQELNSPTFTPVQQRFDQENSQDDEVSDEINVNFGSVYEGDCENILSQFNAENEPIKVSPAVRESFMSMYPELIRSNYQQDELKALVALLAKGVPEEFLRSILPKLKPKDEEGSRLWGSELTVTDAKVKAIRETTLPFPEDFKHLKSYVSGTMVNQGFMKEINRLWRQTISNIPAHVGVNMTNMPAIQDWDRYTASGFGAILVGANSLASVPMVFNDSAKISSMEFVGEKLSSGATEIDLTCVESMIESGQANFDSDDSSLRKLAAITGHKNKSLFFTQDQGINGSSIQDHVHMFVSLIRNRMVLPVKYIQNMHVVSEIAQLFIRFMFVVIKTCPSIFIGTEDKIHKGLAVIACIFKHPNDYFNVFEMVTCQLFEVCFIRMIPFVQSLLMKVVQGVSCAPPKTGHAIADVYKSKFISGRSLLSQIQSFMETVREARTNTLLPKQLKGETVHPALKEECMVQLLESMLSELLIETKNVVDVLALQRILFILGESSDQTMESMKRLIESEATKNGVLSGSLSPSLDFAASYGTISQVNHKATKPCRLFNKGSCTHGDQCPFSHDKSSTGDSNTSSQTQLMTREQIAAVKNHFATMNEIQANVRGALSISHFAQQHPHSRLGNLFSYTRITVYGPGRKDQNMLEGFIFKRHEDGSPISLPFEILEIKDRVSTAYFEETAGHSLALPCVCGKVKDVPFPINPLCVVPKSVQDQSGKSSSKVSQSVQSAYSHQGQRGYGYGGDSRESTKGSGKGSWDSSKSSWPSSKESSLNKGRKGSWKGQGFHDLGKTGKVYHSREIQESSDLSKDFSFPPHSREDEYVAWKAMQMLNEQLRAISNGSQDVGTFFPSNGPAEHVKSKADFHYGGGWEAPPSPTPGLAAHSSSQDFEVAGVKSPSYYATNL